jgi:AcrR family transcriptional regulator
MTVRERRPIDPRVRRSVRALGNALVALMHERDFDRITVQDILDRAGVGRATFYSHYRNKDDVLYSSYEGLFERLDQVLRASPSRNERLIPVDEFLTHLGEVGVFIESLRRSRKMDAIFGLAVDFMARMVEVRIAPAPGRSPSVPAPLVARMLAGALVEMIKWWLDHPTATTRAEMDATFHALARASLQRASYVMLGVKRFATDVDLRLPPQIQPRIR